MHAYETELNRAILALTNAALALQQTLFLLSDSESDWEEPPEVDPMELSSEDRKKWIGRYQKLIKELKDALEEQIQESEESEEANPTIGSLTKALREAEIELANLEAVQALVERLNREITPEEWRRILSEAIRDGQEAALLVLVLEIFIPIIIAYGAIGIRALMRFLLRYFRPRPAQPRIPMRWDRYGNHLRKHLENIKDAIRHRDRTGNESPLLEALRRWNRFMHEFAPYMP